MDTAKKLCNAITIIMCLCILISGRVSAYEPEKSIPPQEKLDVCFAGGFNMADQIRATYTDLELSSLDRALESMNMTRHDMEFRKDYTEGHLAFPLILDMMKRPLHIAPYMDGFCGSIDVLLEKSSLFVPEMDAAAMMHPGVSNRDSSQQYHHAYPAGKTVSTGEYVNTGKYSSLPDPFNYVFACLSRAGNHVKAAFRDLSGDELKILRHKLPQLITWHDVFESPYDETEREYLDKLVEDKKSDAYVDELAARVDLSAMLAAYRALPDPRVVTEILNNMEFLYREIKYYDTPWGTMALGTPGNDTYSGEFSILIDPGGNDTYNNCRIGSAFGTEGLRLGFFLDAAGDDRYFCYGMNFTLGAAVLGVSAFYDLGNGIDVYRGGHVSLGAAMCGMASFLDDGGPDRYSMKVFGQGAAGYGIGVMADRAPELMVDSVSPANKEDEEVNEDKIENNLYEAWLMAQGFSRQWGIGVCHGSRGNDVYRAGGVYLHAPLFNDRYQSFSQGFSIGSREIDYAGGLAFLIDDDGNDYYLGDIYNQGVGYWYAGGFLIDKGGNDHYEMTQYGQGSGIHLAVGGLIDFEGNDSYVMNSGLGQGGSHDFAASVMMDRGGIDRYLGSTSCNGSGLTNAVGLFFDREGDDVYGAVPSAYTLGGGRWARDTGSIGLFIDTGGTDTYTGDGSDNSLWTHTEFGAGFDIKPEIKDAGVPGVTGQADRTRDEKDIDIPEVCSYEGELTQEVFDELWEVAVRWEVGDNRVIVPKARERLIAFGTDILPKINDKFDNSYALSIRAFQEILAKLYEKYPDEVSRLLMDNLGSDDEARKKNGLFLTGYLKIENLGETIVPYLEDKKLRGIVVSTLGDIGSPVGNGQLKQFLSPDNEERLILKSAATLIKLGEHDIYPQLINLCEHEFFTVREGIIAMVAKQYDHFHDYIENDLKNRSTGKQKTLALLNIAGSYPEFEPSRKLYRIVSRFLDNDDAGIRASAVQTLAHWLTFEGEEWAEIQKRIRKKLDDMKKDETDAHVKFLLDNGLDG